LGESAGKKKYKEVCESKAHTLRTYMRRYKDPTIAKKKLTEFHERRGDNLEFSSILEREFITTLSSTIYIPKLYSIVHGKQFGQWCQELEQYVKYDLVSTEQKFCIEFNGDYWHCNPRMYNSNYRHPHVGMNAKEIWDRDERKLRTLKEQGYNIKVVWESEYRETPPESNRGRNMLDKTVKRSKIKSIRKIDEPDEQYVYDIVMKDANFPYFVANGVLVHNSIYFKSDLGEEDITLEEVSAVSDAVCEKVNKSYPKYMQQAFNCTGGREKYIIAEKEIVSDKGIFVKKKHYILHLVELDGKEVDKMKVMGLQIKKTNIPKAIRIKLTEFFERFLKGEDWIVIKRDIVDYKQSLRDGDLFDIGVPSGVNNVEEGTHIFKTNPKEVYHMVRAAILYNECLEAYGDHESYPIRSGDKVKKLYFHKKKNFGLFNAIALPTDMAIRPDWLDDFMPYVDKNRQIKSLVDNPIKNVLNAIGEAVPNSRNTLADELIEF